MVLFVARTFLPDLTEAEGRIDGTACCVAKVRICFGFGIHFIIMAIFARGFYPPAPLKGGSYSNMNEFF